MQGGSQISESITYQEPSPRGRDTAQVNSDTQKQKVQEEIADSSPEQSHLPSTSLQADVETASQASTEIKSTVHLMGHKILSKVNLLDNQP